MLDNIVLFFFEKACPAQSRKEAFLLHVYFDWDLLVGLAEESLGWVQADQEVLLATFFPVLEQSYIYFNLKEDNKSTAHLRRGRDSNSRRTFVLDGFQDHCTSPLCDLSVAEETGFEPA